MVKSFEDNENLTTHSHKIYHLLNVYFQSVFVVEPLDQMPTFQNKTETECVLDEAELINISVQKKLEELIETKSKGCNNIHPRVLRYCAAAKSLGKVPNFWKLLNVTPIFKNEICRKCLNYRPVSLTSVPCKIMESFIHKRILKHCLEKELFTKSQHEFLPRSGCTTNLLEAQDILTKALFHNHAIAVIYTDFAKAFDKVPHQCLLLKLDVYGIHITLL
ncbi:uncharacterized protein LOC124817285 [Hydra vulgaris]|uniref:uncharacterized protein LOC124817285 n=1 Tax=Hydra vulgaris TaxID=6087 RepID=UPI001F5F31E9|nr:uncharacterized protein LOC124817285 [Hydra vulgaris]